MKYTVDKWIHAHYTVEVEADSFVEAEREADFTEDQENKLTFDDLSIGDGGISCITDENGKEYWCE